MLGELWPHIGPLLLQGQLEIHGHLGRAMAALSNHLLEAQDGRAQVWTVIDHGAHECLAALITEIVEEDGKRVVWVSGMAGADILKWGGVTSDRMAEFARAEGCDCVRCAGRKALQRAYRDVRCIGAHESAEDVFIFERAAQ